jgi:hypothetical protein
MYLILEVREQTDLRESTDNHVQIIDHLFGNIIDGLGMLEICVKEFVKKNFGELALETFKIIDLDTKPTEPEELGVYIYRKSSDPQSLYVYRSYQKAIPGYIWGKSFDVIFECMRVFKLKEYTKLSYSDIKSRPSGGELAPASPEYVAIGNLRVPKPLVTSPFADVLQSLKTSTQFLKRKESHSGDKKFPDPDQISKVTTVEHVVIPEPETIPGCPEVRTTDDSNIQVVCADGSIIVSLDSSYDSMPDLVEDMIWSFSHGPNDMECEMENLGEARMIEPITITKLCPEMKDVLKSLEERLTLLNSDNIYLPESDDEWQ